jgi:hypothetical protein
MQHSAGKPLSWILLSARLAKERAKGTSREQVYVEELGTWVGEASASHGCEGYAQVAMEKQCNDKSMTTAARGSK